MSQDQNKNKTGKVTIRRSRKNSMRKDMCRSLYRYLLFAIPLWILAALINPNIVDWSGCCIMMVSALFAALLFWLGGIWVNKGSMIDLLCFDYDNRVLRLERTDFRNRRGRMEIPFEVLTVDIFRSYGERKDRAYFYSKNKKMATLVFAFGWDDDAYDKVKYQLDTYLADKVR